jgi:hypothetical protein
MQTPHSFGPDAATGDSSAARWKLDLSKLPRRNAIIGNPEELVDLTVWDEAEWGEPNLLAECDQGCANRQHRVT